MEDVRIPQRHNMRSASDAREHLAFIGNKIGQHELDSALPFFYCDEPGHDPNLLDSVCMDVICHQKGLCCIRCVHNKHQSHREKVIPLNKFVADLIRNQTDKRQVLSSEAERCSRLKDFVIMQVREYIDGMIEHFQQFLAQVHKYYQIFENQYEDALIKSDVVVHKLLYKQHLRRDHLNNYIRHVIENLGTNTDDIQLRDYERAFNYANNYQREMQQTAKELKFLLTESLSQTQQKIALHKLSFSVPQFETNSILEQQNQLKKQQKTLDDIFGSKRVKQDEGVDSLDTLLHHNATTPLSHQQQQRTLNFQRGAALPLENFPCVIDANRKKVQFSKLFTSVASASILKQQTINSNLRDISCICVLAEDLIAVAGRFSPYVEIYNTSDRSLVHKLNTETQQGIKCMLFLKRSLEEAPAQYESMLVLGTYSDEESILAHRIDILRQNAQENRQGISISVKTAKKYEKKIKDAVTALEHLSQHEFFVAAYSSGSVAIYSIQNSIPLSVLSNLYEGAVDQLYLLENGQIFVSVSESKMRFHTLSQLSHERAEQKISALYTAPYSISCLAQTSAFNEEGSYLKFSHLLAGEVRFEQQSGTIRILRTLAENSHRVSEEAEIEIFSEHAGANTVKEIILLEPRRKRKIAWIVAFGTNHKIRLYEIKAAFTQALKLWEKTPQDFLKTPGTQVLKARLLYETHEYSNLKWGDVSYKAQILSAYENAVQNKIALKFAVVDHASKNAVDIFELEMLVS